MTTIEIHLDDQTLERARRLAEARRCTVEQLIKSVIEQLDGLQAPSDPFLGMMAEEPELMDEIVSEAYQARRRDPLRHADAESAS